ncbi:MAG TPA: MGMT family protein [Steroidobacteraceae bacterium]|jgi:methylated-DNA-protein-cysteine methyltransferase-like protein
MATKQAGTRRKSVKRPVKKQSSAPRAKRTKAQPPPVKAEIRERILAAIKRIPRGRVCTYGNVADVAGLPRRARLVGTVLRQTPASRGLPWYRVINAGGRISFPSGSDAYHRQRSKLEAEGVVFIGGRVDLQRHGWPDRDVEMDEMLWRVG